MIFNLKAWKYDTLFTFSSFGTLGSFLFEGDNESEKTMSSSWSMCVGSRSGSPGINASSVILVGLLNFHRYLIHWKEVKRSALYLGRSKQALNIESPYMSPIPYRICTSKECLIKLLNWMYRFFSQSCFIEWCRQFSARTWRHIISATLVSEINIWKLNPNGLTFWTELQILSITLRFLSRHYNNLYPCSTYDNVSKLGVTIRLKKHGDRRRHSE